MNSTVCGIQTTNVRRSGRIASLALLLVIEACGTSGGSGARFSVVGGETMANPTENVGFALAGNEVTEHAPTLTVHVGEEVTIDFENTHGQYSRTSGIHDIAVVPKLDDLPTLIATNKVADLVLWDSATTRLPSDESSAVTFVPDAVGTYYYICTIPGHAKLGMMGDFVVDI